MMRTTFFLCTALLCLAAPLEPHGVARAASPAPLAPPYPQAMPTASVSQTMIEKCPAPPPAIESLPTQSRYQEGDPTRSKVDPARAEAYDETIKPLRDFQGQVVSWANEFFGRPQKKTDVAACALLWMKAWADADAMRNLPPEQGQFNRDQALAGLALAYLQVSAVEIEGEPGLKPAIVAWFRHLAGDAMTYYDTRAGRVSKANNHRYFAGLGVGAAAVAANDSRLFAWAMATYKSAVCSASPDGSLPLEMGRGSLARDYQVFATGPLVLLAEMGAHNGYDTYAECDGAIRRIVDFGLNALDDPTAVERISGTKQKDLGDIKGYRVAWLAPYLRRVPNSQWQARLNQLSKLKSTSLGGDLGLLYGL